MQQDIVRPVLLICAGSIFITRVAGGIYVRERQYDEAIEFRQSQRKTGYSSALVIARFYACLGDNEQALHWLDIAYQEHDRLLIGLNTYFQLDSLRSDPRFADLVRKVGLPQ